MKGISRREFSALVAAGVITGRFRAPPAFGQIPTTAVTAGDIVERIKRNIGIEWKADTVDTFKAGDPSTVVTGVATTAMATLQVLRQAAQAGANLVITAEPTFYGRADTRTAPGPDPVLAAKNQFIEANRLVVFRLLDHWRGRTPDPFVRGLADALGWSRYAVVGDNARFDVPPVTLTTLASHVKRRLGARGGIRVIGKPDTRVRRVALLPGSTPITASLEALPQADVLIAGEVREWESVEYARDVVASGQRKGMVLVGRVVSEDPGMRQAAQWLRTLVPELPVRHIAVGDPYWRPA